MNVSSQIKGGGGGHICESECDPNSLTAVKECGEGTVVFDPNCLFTYRVDGVWGGDSSL